MDQREHIAVLIVDDDQETRELMELLLNRAGYTTRTAANGREALDVLREICPSLILLDVQMPVMDGMEFREHQRRDRSLLSIPTVVLTGAAVEPLLDLAVDTALRKPVRGADLLAIVRRHCDRKPARSAPPSSGVATLVSESADSEPTRIP